MPTTKPTPAMPPGSGDDDDQGETVILGSLPSDTHRTRVAHPRPVSIAPTATAGGDALPSTHTKPEDAYGSTASTQRQRQPGPLSFTATDRFAVAAVTVMTIVVVIATFIAVTAIGPEPGEWLGAIALVGLVGFGFLVSSSRTSTAEVLHLPPVAHRTVRIVR